MDQFRYGQSYNIVLAYFVLQWSVDSYVAKVHNMPWDHNGVTTWVI